MRKIGFSKRRQPFTCSQEPAHYPNPRSVFLRFWVILHFPPVVHNRYALLINDMAKLFCQESLWSQTLFRKRLSVSMNYYSIFSMGFIPAKQPTGTFEEKAGKSRVRQCSHNRIGGPLVARNTCKQSQCVSRENTLNAVPKVYNNHTTHEVKSCKYDFTGTINHRFLTNQIARGNSFYKIL